MASEHVKIHYMTAEETKTFREHEAQVDRLRVELGFCVDLEGGGEHGWCYSDRPYECRDATPQEAAAWKKIATLERQLIDLRAALEGKWISVDERLPTEADAQEYNCLTIDGKSPLKIVLFLGINGPYIGYWKKTFRATHWQPLPTAPKEA